MFYQTVVIDPLEINVGLIAKYFPEFHYSNDPNNPYGPELIMDITRSKSDYMVLKFSYDYELESVSKNGFRKISSSYSPLELAVLLRRLPVEILTPLKKALSGTSLEIPNICEDFQIPTPAIITLPDCSWKSIVSRRQLLENIEQNFNKSKGIITCCTGLAGVGKSDLVLQYAQNEQSVLHKLWFNAASKEALIENYHQFIADNLVRQPKFTDYEAIAFILNWFTKQSKWLVIYDGVKNYAFIENLIPNTGDGQVLITSRLIPPLLWQKQYQADVVQINCMTLEEAWLLANLNLRDLNEGNLKIPELNKQMGGLPLALIQAINYINFNQIEIPEYLDYYKKNPDYLLAIGKDKSVHHIITENINMYFHSQRPANDSVYARQLLQFSAYFNYEYISFEALETWEKFSYPTAPNCMKRILYELYSYSLVQFGSGSGIRIDPVVQQVIRQNLSNEEQAAISSITIDIRKQFDKSSVPVQVLISYKENPFLNISSTPLKSLHFRSWLGYNHNGDNTLYLNSPSVCYILISELTESELSFIALLEPRLKFRIVDAQDFRPAKNNNVFFPALSLIIGRVLSREINEAPLRTDLCDPNTLDNTLLNIN